MNSEIFNNHRRLMSRDIFACDVTSLLKINPQGFDIDYPNRDSTGGYFSFLFDKALYEDGMKTEFDRMEDFKTKLCREFKFSKDKLVDIMEEFGGTTEDLYFYVADLQGINVDTFNRLKKIGRY